MSEPNEENNLSLSTELVQTYSATQEVVDFIRKKFSRLQKTYAVRLIREILNMNTNIHISTLTRAEKSFYLHNRGKFDEDKKLKVDVIKTLRAELIVYLQQLGKELTFVEPEKTLKAEIVDGKEYYFVDEHTTYKKVIEFVCDEGGRVNFKYSFDDGKLDSKTPTESTLLQRCKIQILSTPIKFDYPIEYSYNCIQCRNVSTRKAYEVTGSRTRLKCDRIFEYVSPSTGEPKSKICGQMVYPDDVNGIVTAGYYYDINYETEDANRQKVGAFSFNKYEPGFYDVVFFKLCNPNKTELFHIIDIKKLEGNKFNIPDKIEGENYVFTLQRAFDKFILEKTGMEIYGLIPIKAALILQYALSFITKDLNFNLQIIGDSSTGKSTVLKYYGFLLANNFNLSTNGLSISVPALRGTRITITLMNKEEKIITSGYLGTFKSIHIDEAGENRDLVQNLKTFLLENNYSYDRAGATGIFNMRTAHVNISENIDFNHVGQYRGMIRKAYKEFEEQIGEEEHVKWDEDWDLHKPIFEYTNPYLRKVIKEKRTELAEQKKFWIDGYEIPLHERFPFYFYLVNEKENNELDVVVQENVCRNTITENFELIKILKSDDIKKLFNLFAQNKEAACDKTAFVEVDKIIQSYGYKFNVRMKAFYYMILKMSRIINMRNNFTEEDYNLVRYFLEKTNRKLDVADTTTYNINGPPNIEQEKRIDVEIENKTKSSNNIFGLPEGEF